MVHLCIAGDFNMLEDPSDYMGGSTVTILGAELAEWETLCFKFSVQNLWFMQSFARRVESLQFSHSNRRVADANLSRIDRFHADQFFGDLGGSLGIVPSTNFSDHAPVKLTLKLRFPVFHDHVKIPNWSLKDDSITESVASMWASVFTPDKLCKVFVALFQLKHLLVSKAKDNKCFLISRLANARRGLASIQCLQERDINSIYLENNLRKLRDEIFLMQSKIADLNTLHLQQNGLKKGTKCLNYFLM